MYDSYVVTHFALDNHFFIIFIQVETVAQFGVVFLLFALGLEFSLAKVCDSCLAKMFFTVSQIFMHKLEPC